jgi:hypothetical protein
MEQYPNLPSTLKSVVHSEHLPVSRTPDMRKVDDLNEIR